MGVIAAFLGQAETRDTVAVGLLQHPTGERGLVGLVRAAFGHMGRKNEVVTKTFTDPSGGTISKEVELFTWEKLDFVDQIKSSFGL